MPTKDQGQTERHTTVKRLRMIEGWLLTGIWKDGQGHPAAEVAGWIDTAVARLSRQGAEGREVANDHGTVRGSYMMHGGVKALFVDSSMGVPDVIMCNGERFLPDSALCAEPQEGEPVALAYPTVHPLEDGDGYFWTSCPECGPDVQVDEDGACVHCGHSAFWYGRVPLAFPAEDGEEG